MVVGGLARALEPSGDMSGMGMMEMASEVSASAAAVDAGSKASDEAPCPDQAPCDMPGMPGQCPSASSCVLAVSAPPYAVALHLPAPLQSPAVASSQVPHTRTSPPELPPPRA